MKKKYKEKYFRNHCKRSDEKYQTVNDDNIVYKVKVDIPIFMKTKQDIKVYDELPLVLDRTFFLSIEFEDSMVYISKNLLVEPTVKC